MTKELKQAFQIKRDELVEQREAFNYDLENRQVESLEKQLNTIVAQRNDKMSLYDIYSQSIKKIDDTIEHIHEIMGVDDAPLEPVEEETPVEEEI